MPNDTSDRVHRDLVANLDDGEALDKMQRGWLSSEEWGHAIERVRVTRFAGDAIVEGNRRVGLLLGERFFSSAEGNILRATIDAVPHQDLFARLLPMMGERLRQSIRFEWVPFESGGEAAMNRSGRTGVRRGFGCGGRGLESEARVR